MASAGAGETPRSVPTRQSTAVSAPSFAPDSDGVHPLLHPPPSHLPSSPRRPAVLNPLVRMASIHALPVELLRCIFLLGTNDPLQDLASPVAPIPRDPPFEVLVSHVCAHWRFIALRMPLIWTSISLTHVRHIRRAKTYLSRSARLPFDILFDSASEADHIPGQSIFRDEFLSAFEPLKPHIDRWASLILRVRDLQCKRHARTVLSSVGPAQHLHTLALWHIEDWTSPERLFGHIGPPPVVVFSGTLPALRRLCLIGVNIQWSEAASPFLRALTDLELGVHSDDVRIPFDRWLALLTHSPGLQRLSLHYSGPRIGSAPWQLPDGPVNLPALCELKLADLDVSYACALLRMIVAPRVRRLHLELGDVDAPQDYTPLVQMLAHAPDPATCPAALDPTMVPPAPALDTIAMFPSLEDLTVASLRNCSLTSWKAFLGASPGVRALSVEVAAMTKGAFDVLAGMPVHPNTLATGHLVTGQQHYPVHLLKGHDVLHVNGDASDADAGFYASVKAAGGHGAISCEPELLPNLRSLRVSGVPGDVLYAYFAARRRVGRPIGRWFVRERERDAWCEKMKVEIESAARAGTDAGSNGEEEETGEEPVRMEWWRDEDDEYENYGSEDGGDRDGEGDEDGDAVEGGEHGDEAHEEAVGNGFAQEGGEVPGSGSDDASEDGQEYGDEAQTPILTTTGMS